MMMIIKKHDETIHAPTPTPMHLGLRESAVTTRRILLLIPILDKIHFIY